MAHHRAPVRGHPPVGFGRADGVGDTERCDVPGVDSAILDPRTTWANKDEYDRTAAKLVDLFVENFAQFADQVDEGVRQAAPKQAQPAQQQATQTQTTPA